MGSDTIFLRNGVRHEWHLHKRKTTEINAPAISEKAGNTLFYPARIPNFASMTVGLG